MSPELREDISSYQVEPLGHSREILIKFLDQGDSLAWSCKENLGILLFSPNFDLDHDSADHDSCRKWRTGYYNKKHGFHFSDPKVFNDDEKEKIKDAIKSFLNVI